MKTKITSLNAAVAGGQSSFKNLKMRAKTEQLIKKAQELDEDIEMHATDTA